MKIWREEHTEPKKVTRDAVCFRGLLARSDHQRFLEMSTSCISYPFFIEVKPTKASFCWPYSLTPNYSLLTSSMFASPYQH